MATQNPQIMQLLAPDIAQEQNQLSRRQQMADLLRKQSLESSGPTEQISGWAIKKSPWEGISKMAQALASNYIQDKTDTRQLELAKALQDRLVSTASGGGAGMSPDDASSAALSMNSDGPTNANAATQNQLMAPISAPGADKYGNKNLLRSLAINALGGEQASGAFWDDQKSTNEAKRDRELGYTTPEARATQDAANLKAGTMSLLPNQTNIMPNGARMVAPDFTTGVAGGFDLQGNPTATEIPGISTIAANRAGGIKQAEASVADRFAVPTKVDAASGPMAMTPAQQRAEANGGIDPANPGVAMARALLAQPGQGQAPVSAMAPAATMLPTPSSPPASMFKNPMQPRPGDSDRTMIFQNEMKAAQGRLASASTPADLARANNDIAALGREMKSNGIPQLSGSTANTSSPTVQSTSESSRKPGGIALQDDSSKKFGEQVASKSADSLLESRDKAKAANDALIGIDKSRKAIAGGVFQGTGADVKLSIAKFINSNVPGVNIDPDKVSNTDYLKSTLGSGLLAEAKTLGTNPSNADATRINDIVGSVGKDPKAMQMILDWRQEMAERSVNNHNSTVSDAEKRGMSSPYDLRVTLNKNAPFAITGTPANIQSLLNKYK